MHEHTFSQQGKQFVTSEMKRKVIVDQEIQHKSACKKTNANFNKYLMCIRSMHMKYNHKSTHFKIYIYYNYTLYIVIRFSTTPVYSDCYATREKER